MKSKGIRDQGASASMLSWEQNPLFAVGFDQRFGGSGSVQRRPQLHGVDMVSAGGRCYCCAYTRSAIRHERLFPVQGVRLLFAFPFPARVSGELREMLTKFLRK
ncbi:uncharacterized protein LOC104433082 isoform X2 [Eucalyptus grandis]|uniref:uncharacterized protein LOC104433082 isoform X2 n=1 Tax=Eucalyptus grandis TaxID=71139 RepID=UPI00192EAA67|nr:uncharacterized protein LOC104433082 isoform X2 [Eucalyptus grandis]